tara:strand:- start:175 stop:1449 length:1275 start_codon:yes stop_codon:yes gene_type:complete
MIKILRSNNKKFLSNLNSFLEKRRYTKSNVSSSVSKILIDIKKNKIKALKKYELKFSNNKKIKITNKEIKKVIKSLDPEVKLAIDFSYNRIKNFHIQQLKNIKNIKYKDKYKNLLEYVNIPIESVGIYVPGNLPSTLLMNSIPAKIAKVKRLVLATPKIKGKLNPAILYAAKKVGINEIYSMGGAQAIGSLTYIQKVNKIIGPGNKFVAEAKKQLSGKLIGTESMFAGPSEICVVADKNSDINQIATSMVSQAEHDIDSQSILITKHENIIKNVVDKISELIKKLPRKKIAYKSIKKHGLIIIAKNDKEITDAINIISTEHLELLIKNSRKFIKKIYNAGSICNGKYSPMCLSDFTVGTNHVLPTAGSSRYSSGLNINEFIKKISIVTLNKLGVEKIANPAITLAKYEQLVGHAESIRSRIRRN